MFMIVFNRNSEGLNLEEIKGFKVPPKMLEKMKNHMRSKQCLKYYLTRNFCNSQFQSAEQLNSQSTVSRTVLKAETC